MPTGWLDGNVHWEVARLSSKAVLTLDSSGGDMDMGMVAKTEGVEWKRRGLPVAHWGIVLIQWKVTVSLWLLLRSVPHHEHTIDCVLQG